MKVDKIIVGIDFRGQAAKVAEWLNKSIDPTIPMVLAHTLEQPSGPTFMSFSTKVSDENTEKLHEQAGEGMQALKESLGGKRDVTIVISSGDAADQLAALAELEEASIIAVAENEASKSEPNLLGGTAEKLSSAAMVPVLVARAMPQGGIKRILVAVDDSATALAAFELAGELSVRLGASVEAVHALSDSLFDHLALTFGESKIKDFEQEYREEFSAWFKKSLQERSLSEGIKLHLPRGRAAAEVLLAADQTDADLLVFGSRGAAGIQGLFGGRTSRTLIRSAGCSVLVVPEQAK